MILSWWMARTAPCRDRARVSRRPCSYWPQLVSLEDRVLLGDALLGAWLGSSLLGASLGVPDPGPWAPVDVRADRRLAHHGPEPTAPLSNQDLDSARAALGSSFAPSSFREDRIEVQGSDSA